jgi:hypothetical protein
VGFFSNNKKKEQELADAQAYERLRAERQKKQEQELAQAAAAKAKAEKELELQNEKVRLAKLEQERLSKRNAIINEANKKVNEEGLFLNVFNSFKDKHCPYHSFDSFFETHNPEEVAKAADKQITNNFWPTIQKLADSYANGELTKESFMNIYFDAERGYPAYIRTTLMTFLEKEGLSNEDRSLRFQLKEWVKSNAVEGVKADVSGGSNGYDWVLSGVNVNLSNRQHLSKSIEKATGKTVADFKAVGPRTSKLRFGEKDLLKEFLYDHKIGSLHKYDSNNEDLDLPSVVYENDGLKVTIASSEFFFDGSPFESNKSKLEFLFKKKVVKVEKFTTEGKIVITLDYANVSSGPVINIKNASLQRSARPAIDKANETPEQTRIREAVERYAESLNIVNPTVLVQPNLDIVIWDILIPLRLRKSTIKTLEEITGIEIKDIKFEKPDRVVVTAGPKDPVLEFLYDTEIGKKEGEGEGMTLTIPNYEWNSLRSKLTFKSNDFLVPASEVEKAKDKLAYYTQSGVMVVTPNPTEGSVTVLFNRFPAKLPLTEIPDMRKYKLCGFIGKNTEGGDEIWDYGPNGGLLFRILGIAGSGKTKAMLSLAMSVLASERRPCHKIVLLDTKLKEDGSVPERNESDHNSKDYDYKSIVDFAKRRKLRLVTINPNECIETSGTDRFGTPVIKKEWVGLKKAIAEFEETERIYNSLEVKSTSPMYILNLLDEASEYLQIGNDKEQNELIVTLSDMVQRIALRYRSTSLAPTIFAAPKVSTRATRVNDSISYSLLGAADSAHDSKELLDGNDVLKTDTTIKHGKFYLKNRISGDNLVKTPFSDPEVWPDWMMEEPTAQPSP